LTLIAYGAGTPGGLFSPSLILGAALGHLVGFLAHTLELYVGLPLGVPQGVSPTTTYALAGMGAFFSAVTRGPITAIVIVFEITTDFNLVLPLMVGSVVAYLISDRIASGSIYTRLLAWNGIFLDRDITSESWAELTAADLMQRRVETLASQMPLSEAVQAFSRSHHRGFPVVDAGRLVGIVTQTDLADPSRRPVTAEEITLADIMTPNPVTVHPADPLPHVLYLLNRYKVSRLPVTEGHKLVGIITRADIIRAQADQVTGEFQSFGPQPEPAYVVYQTRSPATGKGRLLVPLSNPKTAPALLELAAAIAREHQYELECLHVMVIPRGQSPTEVTLRTTLGRRLLRQAEQVGRQWQLSIHTQICIAHDPAQAMLEAIHQRHIDRVLMGWDGKTTTPGRIFGSVVDTIIRQAACEVVLVKFKDQPSFNHWLLPIAGGPNAEAAKQLLPALLTLGHVPRVCICQVFDQEPIWQETQMLRQTVQQLNREINHSVSSRFVWGKPVPDAVLQLAGKEKCDVIILGASREGLLTQVIKGNIPEAIARTSDRTVILVRGEITPVER
ncbi:MAG TPA: CBS domain-containing protein, partial [Coleofasciculaceae cyanobacterium]